MFTLQSIYIYIFYNYIYHYIYILIINVSFIIYNRLLPSVLRNYRATALLKILRHVFYTFFSEPFKGIIVKSFNTFSDVKQYIFVGVKICQNFSANPIVTSSFLNLHCFCSFTLLLKLLDNVVLIF